MKNNKNVMFIISTIISIISLLIFFFNIFFVSDFIWWSGIEHGGKTLNVDPLTNPEVLFRLFFTCFFIPIILWIVTFTINRNKKNIEISENNLSDSKIKKNTISIWGFILSLISMFTGLGLLGYIGMTCGIIGLIQIKKNKQKGKGLAITAIIIGTIYGLIMSLLHILVILR